MDKRDNSGVLFKNSRKEKDSHPDYQGEALIDGIEHWLSAWIKDGKKGKFMSLAFKVKEAKVEAKPPKVSHAKGGVADIDDDLPF